MIRKNWILGLSLVLLVGLHAQETVMGRITYLTADRVYTDLGSGSGIALGDTLQVLRRDTEVGLLQIESLARNSSVCIPLTSVEVFQLGDQILGVQHPTEISKEDSLPSAVVPAEPSEAEPTPVIRLEQNGTLSLRANASGYSSSASNGRVVGSFQYGAGLVEPFDLKIWGYGRIDDQGDLNIYTLRGDVGRPDDRLAFQIGRVYPSKLVGIGATDGLYGVLRLGKRRELGGLVGFQPKPGSLDFDPNLKKVGAYYGQPYQLRNQVKGEFLLALVGQYTQGVTDREFMYLRMGARFGRDLNFQVYHTLDIYRQQQLYNRGKAQPISSQISMSWKPGKELGLSVRYTTRRQILYQSQTQTPDSLFEDELRSGLYGAISWRNPDLGQYRISLNLRTQSGASKNSVYVATDYALPEPVLGKADLDFRVAWLRNMLITGLRSRARYALPLRKDLRSWVEYELYLYGYGNRMIDFNRHSLQGGMSWRILATLSLTASTELSLDGNFHEVYAFGGLSYRF